MKKPAKVREITALGPEALAERFIQAEKHVEAAKRSLHKAKIQLRHERKALKKAKKVAKHLRKLCKQAAKRAESKKAVVKNPKPHMKKVNRAVIDKSAARSK